MVFDRLIWFSLKDKLININLDIDNKLEKNQCSQTDIYKYSGRHTTQTYWLQYDGQIERIIGRHTWSEDDKTLL